MLSFFLREGFPVIPGAVWCAPAHPNGADWEDLTRRVPLPWMLRSSAEGEDAAGGSMAGCYRSVGPVFSTRQAQEAFARVRTVSPAAHRMAVFAGREAGPPAVLVQTWRRFAASGVALVFPAEARVQVEGAFGGSVVSGDAPQALPAELEQAVSQFALSVAAVAPPDSAAWDMEWGAEPENDGWRVTLLQWRPLAPSLADPPAWMQEGVWECNLRHHPRPLSFLHASLADRLRAHGVPQGTWRGWLYERTDAPPDISGFPPAPSSPGSHLQRRVDMFLRFVFGYLRRRRPHRPGENCISAVFRRCPPARAARFCRYFPQWWDVAAPPLPETAWESVTPAMDATEPPWRVFAAHVDSREQDDWVFALMQFFLREEFLAWGKNAVARGRLPRPEDVFFLTVDEVLEDRFLPGIVDYRRQLLASWEAWVAPERVEHGRPVWPFRSGMDAGEETAGELAGIPVIPGVAQGPAALSGAMVQPGSVAVLHAAAPQDIVRLACAAALVVELPGTAGHALLIARELGIPTVVGVAGCTRRIPPGARVWVDGTAGRVTWKLEKK